VIMRMMVQFNNCPSVTVTGIGTGVSACRSPTSAGRLLECAWSLASYQSWLRPSLASSEMSTHARLTGTHAASFQGLTLVHFSAQLERFLWNRGCA